MRDRKEEDDRRINVTERKKNRDREKRREKKRERGRGKNEEISENINMREYRT